MPDAIVQTNPYDSAEDILQLARSISNDASTSNGIAGDILADSQPYVYPILREVYRDFQDELISLGVETFTKYGFMENVTPSAAQNQREQLFISYLGYWNGQATLPNPTLPPDMIKPLELWNAPQGAQAWYMMRQVPDSISSRAPQPLPCIWDFQNDKLILPQATQTYAMKMKYLCYAPDITGPTSQVYCVHAQTAMAAKFVSRVCAMLGGLEMAAIFDEQAKRAINKIANRSARKEQYTNFQRIPFRGRAGRGGRGYYGQ